MNLNKGINLLNKLGADAILLCNEANMHYFCYFSPSEGMVLITKNGGYHIVDSRYTETAILHSKLTGLKAVEINTSFIETLKELIKKENIHSLLFENNTISFKQYNLLNDVLSVDLLPLDNNIMDLRNTKEQYEIDLIKAANNIAEKSFTELLNFIKPGKSEKELAAQFDYIMAKNGSDGISFDTILLTGVHTSMPHGIPDDRKINSGDFVLFDFGATYKGYHSDMTRTIAVKSATDEMKNDYNLVLKAQIAGIKALSAGTKCSDVYKASYDVLESQGKGKYFRHSLGHGVGIEIHEGYNASPKSKDIFQVGNVTSIEPGIYMPDKYGIRIEDMLYLSPHGRENLSNITKELLIV